MSGSRILTDRMSGRFRQPGDAGGKRTLSGRFLRTGCSAGRIESIELPELPSGMVSITNKDASSKIKFGSLAMSLFTGRDILWKGEPILAAAGPDTDVVDDWISRIKIEISEPDEIGEAPLTEKLIEKGSTVEAFSKAFQVVEEKIEIPRTAAAAERQTVVCIKDGANYTIHAANIWPGSIRRNVAAVLKTEKKNIHVKTYPVKPGSNREVWYPAVSACHAALLSVKAKKSIRISSLPEENALYAPGLPGGEFHIRGAVDSEGRITALEVIFTIFAGALFPLEEEFFERVVLGLFSLYPCRNYSILGRIQHDPLPPSTFGPAAGFELGFLAGELFASSVAEHSLSPPGIWHRESFPVSGQAFGPGIQLPKDFPVNQLLQNALESSDFERKSASFEQTGLSRKQLGTIPEFYRGIGLSCAWFGNGFITNPKELGTASLSMKLDKDGSLSVDIPTSGSGGIMEQLWSDICGRILGIDSKSVNFNDSVPRSGQEPGPSILGRNTSVYTKLLELAGNDLLKRRFRDPLPISVTRNRRRSGSRSWNSDLLEGSPFEAVSWGVGIVEVAVSTVTLEVKPTRVWLVIDGGVLLMPDFAKSAVESSTEESLRWCHNSSGRKELPMIDIQFHSTGGKRYSKDVSTLPWLLIPAAFIRAVRQASGVNISRIPVTPEQLQNGGTGI